MRKHRYEKVPEKFPKIIYSHNLMSILNIQLNSSFHSNIQLHYCKMYVNLKHDLISLYFLRQNTKYDDECVINGRILDQKF